MDLQDDSQLLRQFVQSRCTKAFEQLVQRHITLVYSAALRQVHDRDLAEDVTQATFIVLVQKAATIQDMKTIGGWLLKTTRYAAMHAMRKQNTHRRVEQAAARERPEMMQPAEATADEWERLLPVLDEAMTKL